MSADYVCLIGIWVWRSTLFRQRVDFAEIKTVSDLAWCFRNKENIFMFVVGTEAVEADVSSRYKTL